MALQSWMVAARWEDKLTAYRRGAKDAHGNPAADYAAVTGIARVPCKLHSTDNYDEVQGPMGRVKVNNLMTSDKVHLPLGYDLRADDVVRIDRSDGEPLLFKVAGAVKGRTILKYQRAYLTTDPAAFDLLIGSVFGGVWPPVF